MDNIPDRIDSRFRFVLLAAERAEQMMLGATPKVEMPKHKLTRVAMREVASDLIEWGYGAAPEPEEAEAEAEA